MSVETSTMWALVRTSLGVEFMKVPRPQVRGDLDVRVRVVRGGLCRTDLHVAYGRTVVATPRVLGHELSGVVLDLGAQVHTLRRGARVAIEPLLACHACAECARGRACSAPKMLGLDLDGGFAEEIVVPATRVHAVPEAMSFERAAYVEPVAAAMAVLSAGLTPQAPGRVVGAGRIAELTRRALEARGFARVEACEPTELEPASLDWVIETTGSSSSLAASMRALRQGGTLVLKARPAQPAALDIAFAVQREITLRAVRYAPFEAAIDLLASPNFRVDDLFEGTHPLSRFAEVFERAERSESGKVFFAPSGEAA